MAGDPNNMAAILAASQAGGNILSKLIPQAGSGPGMTAPIQIPKPFPAMNAPDMQQANIGTPQPVGVPTMAGAIQRPSMQQTVSPFMQGIQQGGVGQPPPGSHQPVNPGADPNSLIMLQILKLLGQG